VWLKFQVCIPGAGCVLRWCRATITGTSACAVDDTFSTAHQIKCASRQCDWVSDHTMHGTLVTFDNNRHNSRFIYPNRSWQQPTSGANTDLGIRKLTLLTLCFVSKRGIATATATNLPAKRERAQGGGNEQKPKHVLLTHNSIPLQQRGCPYSVSQNFLATHWTRATRAGLQGKGDGEQHSKLSVDLSG
jgi:hypothetical protein